MSKLGAQNLYLCRWQGSNLRPWPYEDPALTTELHRLVAGTGIAPVSRGYGPRKILLLHPAGPFYYIFQKKSTLTTNFIGVRVNPIA